MTTKITIGFDNELDAATQNHFETGQSVQNYICSALLFYDAVRALEKKGMIFGYGTDSTRFRQYNTVIQTSEFSV